MLWIYSLAHFCVDFSCAYFIYSRFLNPWQWVAVLVAFVALWLLGHTSRREGFDFVRNRWVICMWVSVVSGVASALLDKHLMSSMQPMFVQGWCNFYITLILAATLLIVKHSGSPYYKPYKHDWLILVIALFITWSDFLYFLSLSGEGAMLSVVSILRRSSVIITFICGALFFKEKNLKSKGLALLILLVSMVILVLAS